MHAGATVSKKFFFFVYRSSGILHAVTQESETKWVREMLRQRDAMVSDGERKTSIST